MFRLPRFYNRIHGVHHYSLQSVAPSRFWTSAVSAFQKRLQQRWSTGGEFPHCFSMRWTYEVSKRYRWYDSCGVSWDFRRMCMVFKWDLSPLLPKKHLTRQYPMLPQDMYIYILYNPYIYIILVHITTVMLKYPQSSCPCGAQFLAPWLPLLTGNIVRYP